MNLYPSYSELISAKHSKSQNSFLNVTSAMEVMFKWLNDKQSRRPQSLVADTQSSSRYKGVFVRNSISGIFYDSECVI